MRQSIFPAVNYGFNVSENSDQRGKTQGQSRTAGTHSTRFILFAVLDLLIKQLCEQEMKGKKSECVQM